MEDTLKKINEAGLKLLESLTPEETYKIVLFEALALVSAESGSIFLERDGILERVFTSHDKLNKTKIRRRGFAYTSFKSRKPQVINIAKIEDAHPHLKAMGIQTTIFIPLSYQGESIGVLTLNSSKDESFDDKQMSVLTLFGSMSSLAIKKSQMYSETKKALEIRDMFISMAAHELRTPLTSINGYIQLLYGKLAGREGVEGKWMHELFEESKRLTSLVKELLEVNRLKSGQIQFMWQECNLLSIIQEAMNEVKQIHPDRQITLEKKVHEGNDLLIGDASKLVKVFANIIDNAVKYSPDTTPVHILVAEKNNFFSVFIKDLGRGIDEKDLPHIFDGHHMGSSGEEGMGIGLYFVESVIRQHKGAINVKTKVKKGSTFEVRLPKSKI